MPCPENSYILDSAVTMGHIPVDAGCYVWSRDDADDIIDGIYATERGRAASLDACGSMVEEAYIEARSKMSLIERAEISLKASREIQNILPEIVLHIANRVTQEGANKPTRALIAAEVDNNTLIGGMNRCIRRIEQDVSSLTTQDIFELRRIQEAKKQAEVARQLRLQNAIGQVVNDAQWADNADGSRHTPISATSDIRAVKRHLKQKVRNPIKRSLKLAERIMGTDLTRMFVAGDEIRIEGQYAIYGLAKHSSMSDAHGGNKALRVYDKTNPNLMLCNVCVYTPNVPLMDHIVGLYLRIKNGLELEVLESGNLGDVDAVVKDHEWLHPFMTTHQVRKIVEGDDFKQPTLDELFGFFDQPTEAQKRNIEAGKRLVYQTLYARNMISGIKIVKALAA